MNILPTKSIEITHTLCVCCGFRRFLPLWPSFAIIVTSVSRRRKKTLQQGNRRGRDRNRFKNLLGSQKFLGRDSSWFELGKDWAEEEYTMWTSKLNKVSLFNPPYTQQFCHWVPVLYRFSIFCLLSQSTEGPSEETSWETRDLIKLGKLNGTVPWLPQMQISSTKPSKTLRHSSRKRMCNKLKA